MASRLPKAAHAYLYVVCVGACVNVTLSLWQKQPRMIVQKAGKLGRNTLLALLQCPQARVGLAVGIIGCLSGGQHCFSTGILPSITQTRSIRRTNQWRARGC